jgi:hypothetical protein
LISNYADLTLINLKVTEETGIAMPYSNTMKTFIIKSSMILSGLLLINYYVTAQGKFEVSFGLGMPEGINLRAKYGKNFQVGLSQGLFPNFNPGNNEPGIFGTTSLDLYYHFAGKSKYTIQKLWYIMVGLSKNYPNEEDYQILPYVRFGRTINFSEKIGLNLDFGPVFLFEPGHDSPVPPVLPSGYVGLFIRL